MSDDPPKLDEEDVPIPVAWGSLVEVDDGLLAQVPSFWSGASCRGTWDQVNYFPGRGGVQSVPRSLCARCEVRLDCLGFALMNDERFGIWGGLSERERSRLRSRIEDGEPLDDILREQHELGCPTGLPHQRRTGPAGGSGSVA